MNATAKPLTFDLILDTTDSDLLDEYSHNGNVRLREAVARNPHSSPETLVRLSKSKVWEIQWCVSANPNMPVKTLIKLATRKSEYFKRGVACNPNTPAFVLAELAEEWDYFTREGVSENGNTSEETLASLARDEPHLWSTVTAKERLTSIYLARAKDPTTTTEALDAMAIESHANVRLAIAKHKNASIDVLAYFSEDKNARVKAQALKALEILLAC